MTTQTRPKPTPFSALGRSLDPLNYPTHRAIFLLTPITGTIHGAVSLFSTGDLGAAVMAGIWTGAVVFMAWVLARELDIDYEYSAFVAVALAFIGALVWSAPLQALVAPGVLILVARMVNRVVGPHFTVIDSIVVLTGGVLLALLGNWPMVAALAVAFLLDALLIEGLRWQLIFVALAGLLAVVGAAFIPGTRDSLSVSYLIAGLVIAGAFGIIIVTTRSLKTGTDMPGYTLHLSRVRALMIFALLLAVVTALYGGDSAIYAYLPLWAVLAGVPLYRAYITWIKR